tara:strand:- start:1115 stop:1414 length:300 start_codon:yes stop_codon:yes gene_type:complete
MFTDYEPEPMDDNEIDREDLEECVLEQMLKDIGTGLVGEILYSLSKLSQDSLLEFLPSNHPVWTGRRQRVDMQDALLMPPYVIPSLDPRTFTQFLWSSN